MCIKVLWVPFYQAAKISKSWVIGGDYWNTSLFFLLASVSTSVAYVYTYIFASIFTKWKIFHQCLLIPQSRKTELIFFISLYFCLYFPELENISPIHFTSRKWKKLKWFSILPNGKKYQIEKLKNMFISTKWKKWSNFLYFSTNWTSFTQSGKHFIIAIYFHKMQKKLSNFLYFFIHISFHFHDVDYISPTRFISTKWKILH